MTDRTRHRTFAAIALAAAILLSFLWFAAEVREGETLTFDLSVRAWVHAFASDGLTAFFLAITYLGSTLVVLGIASIAVIGFLWKKDRRSAVALGTVVIGELFWNNVIKFSYERPRPEAYFGYQLPSSYSFPSGHSFASFCLYISLAYLLTRQMKDTTGVAIVWASAVLVTLLIGISRVYLGVHYPTDVLAGYVAAAMWSSIVLSGYHYLNAKRPHPKDEAG